MTLRMPTHVLIRLLNDDWNRIQFLCVTGRACKSVYAARPFYSIMEAREYRDCRYSNKTWIPACLYEEDNEPTVVLKHYLRYQAKHLFRLKASAPLCVIADRYEEEGMCEEAEFLRK